MSRKSCLIRLFKTTVSCKLFTAIILSVFLVQPALTYAGVVIGGTRVVYLSNNPDKLGQLEEYGIKINERVSTEEEITKYNIDYLRTKRDKMGHMLDIG